MYNDYVSYVNRKDVQMSIPETIKRHKPTDFGACEIRFIGGYYYVYPVTSRWDPTKGRSQKVTLKSVGKITEADGFIPNANGMRRIQEMRITPDVAPSVKNYGAYETLLQLSPKLSDELREHFPDCFREIRTLALIRLVDGVPAKLIRPVFLDSCMCDICPDIATSEATVRRFVASLGEMQDRAQVFMKSQIMPGTKLLFDGSSFFARMGDSLAAKGYNPDHGLDPQVRILYIFEKDSHRPVFYKILQGSIVDRGAFIDTLRDSGVKDCVIIADKGFYSKTSLTALIEAGTRFILPLQDNTKKVEPEFYENTDDNKFDGVFTYKGRSIFYRKVKSGVKGNWIYTFRDSIRRDSMQARFVEQAEKNYGEEGYVPMDVLKQVRMGYFSFCSNIDTEAKEIYLDYKERWNIEECFDYLKNSVSPGASYAHNDNYFRGWAFLNHISLLYYYGLINALRSNELDSKYTPEDVLKLTKNIYKVDSGDGQGYKVSAVQKKTRELLQKLGVDLLRKK